MALDLGKQVGPLPLGAWAAIVAGGLGIAWYTRGSQPAADTVEPERDTSGDPGVGEGPTGFINTPNVTPQTPGTTVPLIEDNQAWAAYVMRELIGRFNYDPLLVDSAVRKYITGAKLSTSEFVIIRQALLIMVPPDPLPADENTNPPPPNVPSGPPPPTNVPGPVRPKPPIKPKPKPKPQPAARYYTVKKGDTLWALSKRYYGSGRYFTRIFNANLKGKRLPDGTLGKISNPNLIQTGWRLVIP